MSLRWKKLAGKRWRVENDNGDMMFLEKIGGQKTVVEDLDGNKEVFSNWIGAKKSVEKQLTPP